MGKTEDVLITFCSWTTLNSSYAKNVEELNYLVQRVRDISEDIGMEFEIQKCAIVETRRGRMVENEGTNLPNGEIIKALKENEGYKYLGFWEMKPLHISSRNALVSLKRII